MAATRLSGFSREPRDERLEEPNRARHAISASRTPRGGGLKQQSAPNLQNGGPQETLDGTVATVHDCFSSSGNAGVFGLRQRRATKRDRDHAGRAGRAHGRRSCRGTRHCVPRIAAVRSLSGTKRYPRPEPRIDVPQRDSHHCGVSTHAARPRPVAAVQSKGDPSTAVGFSWANVVKRAGHLKIDASADGAESTVGLGV